MGMTPEQMEESIIRNLQEKTGKTLEEWINILKKNGPAGKKEQAAWLKKEHGLGSVQASIIAGRANRPADWKPKSPEELLHAQFSGEKAALRQVYEKIIEMVKRFGDDVEISPRNTMVSLICGKQFGKIVVATKSRIDLGLKLPGIEPTKRLLDHGGIVDEQITHRIELTDPGDVDDEVTNWLRKAYERRKK